MNKLKNNMKTHNKKPLLYIMIILFCFFNILPFIAVAENITAYSDVKDADLQYQIAIMFERGEGVAQDDKLARLWFRRAAIQGHSIAQFNLGWMCANGYGGKKDNISAYYWFLKSAVAKVNGSKAQLAALDRVITAKDKAYAILKVKQNNNGNMLDDMPADINLNIINEKDMHASFINARRDYNGNNFKLAIIELNQLANNGHADAQNLLGLHLMSAENGIDKIQAFKWLFIAAKQGNAAARYNLAISFSKGIGIGIDSNKALRWLKLAKESTRQLNNYDYQEISIMFKEKSEYKDSYIAARQGYISASNELLELINYSQAKISAQPQFISN